MGLSVTDASASYADAIAVENACSLVVVIPASANLRYQRAADSSGCGIAAACTFPAAARTAAGSYARPFDVPSALRPYRAASGSAGGLPSAQRLKVMVAELK